MKKKLRRQLKGWLQIGNYIYADMTGKIQIVVPPKYRPEGKKIAQDFEKLLLTYGTEVAYNYLICIENYLK